MYKLILRIKGEGVDASAEVSMDAMKTHGELDTLAGLWSALKDGLAKSTEDGEDDNA